LARLPDAHITSHGARVNIERHGFAAAARNVDEPGQLSFAVPEIAGQEKLMRGIGSGRRPPDRTPTPTATSSTFNAVRSQARNLLVGVANRTLILVLALIAVLGRVLANCVAQLGACD
jgi:hypothetical protein